MAVDLTKLILYTPDAAFKNNTIYTGTKTISGSTTPGTNQQTFIVPLGAATDIVDIVFNGPTDHVFGSDPRPDGGWFKQLQPIYVPTDNAHGGNPSQWRLYASINGFSMIITALMIQQFLGAEVLTATNFSYRLIDYSVF